MLNFYYRQAAYALPVLFLDSTGSCSDPAESQGRVGIILQKIHIPTLYLPLATVYTL
jgi:hypothetical protein